MEWTAVLTSILALIFVLSLIGLIAYGLKKFSVDKMVARPTSDKEGKRLGIVEVKAIDMRRRLVLIRRDNQEHLLLLTPEREMLIESVESSSKSKKK